MRSRKICAARESFSKLIYMMIIIWPNCESQSKKLFFAEHFSKSDVPCSVLLLIAWRSDHKNAKASAKKFSVKRKRSFWYNDFLLRIRTLPYSPLYDLVASKSTTWIHNVHEIRICTVSQASYDFVTKICFEENWMFQKLEKVEASFVNIWWQV